ncbi:MFS transporter [Corynebacterium freiburgense]|uniref:MFS transporter n=1 Tax=Corynebacterium freiburgense TaxID=556548 RepID=UPI0003FDD737|nr:MFS transporter [Corynebacterium freiburgense]WJZ01959.1 Major Facilitator Superfamily protein [Corynebacterium freiburgense]
MSIVKAFNKGYAGRIIRIHFPSSDGSKILQRATSLGIFGGLAGAGTTGLVTDSLGITWCFTFSAALYILSLVFAKLSLSRSSNDLKPTTTSPKPNPHQGSPKHLTRLMTLVLVFSVPSSAFLPYLNTLIVPLADSLQSTANANSASLVSVLTLATSAAGIFAGAILGTDRLPLPITLNTALPLAAISSFGLAFITSPYTAITLIFFASLFGTAHVLTMQVLTNQAPPADQVASFTLLRNAFAGLSKAGASIIAGSIVATGDLSLAWHIASVILVAASTTWLLFVRSHDLKANH